MRPESSEPSSVLQRLTRLDKMNSGTYKGKKQSMKRERQKVIIRSNGRLRSFRCGHFLRFLALTFLAVPSIAHASLFHGETLDAIANGISWVVIVIGPIIGIAIFWMVHILPEKIAEKKRHPQAKAIQCVCLLSLCFGGLLWPFAWLWAYTKPVLHKMAYGTDVDESHGHVGGEIIDEAKEIEKLRARVAELEAKTRSGPS
jgi:CBS domain containing-hemolysin-like protein